MFVSSTFRDMQAERDELVKRVFPEIRELCDARGVTWGDIDLRWGVSDEQQAEGKVLPICLALIKACRPYFIGLLGERYGWVPQEIPADLVLEEPWLAEHRDRSVTELEIMHGVLNDPSLARQALFYFRDPAYAPDSSRMGWAFAESADPRDIQLLGLDQAELRATARRARLCALKDRIRSEYRAGRLKHAPRENYADPKALGELVRQDLRALIDELFPAEDQPDEVAREQLEQDAFARNHAQVYIERPECFARLDAHAAADGPPLVLIGDSGCGKSALLANWVRRFRETSARPLETQAGENLEVEAGAQSSASPLIIEHYIGATQASSDWVAIVRRILGEFNFWLDLGVEIPADSAALKVAFSNALYRAAAKACVILVVDGLNQLEDRDQALDLPWLPPEVPAKLRLILSTLPGRPLDELARRGWPTMKLEPLSRHERRTLITRYLDHSRRGLDSTRLERIAAAEQTNNPLYLRTLLDELRLWGKHETLEQRIDHYLEAKTLSDLFAKIFVRWEKDYEGDSDLVGETLSLLWAARRGLSETELLELLGADHIPLARAELAPFLRAANGALIARSGLLGFSNDYIRAAVRATYVPARETRCALHMRMAEYFAARPRNTRQADELPWHFAKGEAWQKLYDLLAEPEFFQMAWRADQPEVKMYWSEVEANSRLRMVDAYATVIHGSASNSFAWNVAHLLANNGYPEEALTIRRQLIEKFRASGDIDNLQSSLGNCANVLYARGQLNEAMEHYKEQESIARKSGNRAALQDALGGQSNILFARGQLDAAMAFCKEQERISRQLGDLESLHLSLGSQANILYARGCLEEAMVLQKQKERISRQLGNLDSLQISLGSQANILYARGQLDGAIAVHKEEERICRRLGRLDALHKSLGNQALILATRGQLDEAMALHKEQERIARRLGALESVQVSLGNQGNILYRRGQLNEAIALHKEKELICRELGNLDGIQVSLGNQATVLIDLGQLDEAMALGKEQERISRQLGSLEGLQRSLSTQMLVLKTRGLLDDAMTLCCEQERLCRQLGNLDALQICLGNKANILHRRRQLDEAMVLHKEKECICRELGNLEGLQASLASQALVHDTRGQFNDAMRLYREAERICRQLGNLRDLQAILGNQALIFRAQGHLNRAMALCNEQENICRHLGNPVGLAASLANQALILCETQPFEAYRRAEEAVRIAHRHGLTVVAEETGEILEAIRRQI